LSETEIFQLAESKSLTPQTLMYAFLMSLGGGYITPLSGTKSQDHMAQDVAVMERIQAGESIFDTEDEIHHIATLLGMPGL